MFVNHAKAGKKARFCICQLQIISSSLEIAKLIALTAGKQILYDLLCFFFCFCVYFSAFYPWD